jgi:hypothetical protein
MTKTTESQITEAQVDARIKQAKRKINAMLKQNRANMRALDERIARNSALMAYLDEMALRTMASKTEA